jgi:hypothetical protein
MEREHSTVSETDKSAKNDQKSSAELLHLIQNLIPNDVVNIQ